MVRNRVRNRSATGESVSDIVEAWKWRPAGEIIERLLGESARTERRGEAISLRPTEHPQRDRYYTQARRLHVKQLMKERG